MKKLALAMACVLAVGIAQADDKGGFSQDAAPPPPHKLDDGYRGVEDGRTMTVISFAIKAAPSPPSFRPPRLTNSM